jgi:hypothetical protein
LTAAALAQVSAEPQPGPLQPRPGAIVERRSTQAATAPPVTIPAGTKVPLALKQAISTKSARQGDPVYAVTNFPLALDGKMMIPAGTYVQGVIDHIKRAGRVHGKAEILMHFNTLVYPTGYTVMLPGTVDNMPGAEHQKVKCQEGTIQQEGQTKEKIGTAASTAATGAVIGGVSGGGKGALIGSGIGGAAGMAIAMLTRGNDVRLEPGTGIEMVFQRALALDPARVEEARRETRP